jgi:hypothetical protein
MKRCADYKSVSRAWRAFILSLKRAETGFPCVRVFEPHPGGHGWHVHFITGDFLHVNMIRKFSTAAGFGRIHVKQIPLEAVVYLAKYISKARRLAYSKGKRLWACCMFDGVKVKDITIKSEFSDICRSKYQILKRMMCDKTERQIRFAAFLSTCALFIGGWPVLFDNMEKNRLNKWETDFLTTCGASCAN